MPYDLVYPSLDPDVTTRQAQRLLSVRLPGGPVSLLALDQPQGHQACAFAHRRSGVVRACHRLLSVAVSGQKIAREVRHCKELQRHPLEQWLTEPPSQRQRFLAKVRGYVEVAM